MNYNTPRNLPYDNGIEVDKGVIVGNGIDICFDSHNEALDWSMNRKSNNL